MSPASAGTSSVPLSVSVATFGRYHALQLAEQLQSRGVLDTLYLSYLGPTRLPLPSRQSVNSFPFFLVQKIGQRLRTPEWLGSACVAAFDGYSATRFRQRKPGRPILHAWSEYCYQTMRRAKRQGYTLFLEHSCPHFDTVNAVLSQEAEVLGLPWSPPRRANDIVRRELDLVDRVVVCSNYGRDSFIRAGYPADRVVVAYLGCNFAPAAAKPLRRDGPFTVLLVGTDPLRKGAHYLLKAWRQLDLPDARLIVRCPVPESVRPLLDHPSIRFVPHVSREELRALYEQATVFCLPSVDDGFGMVVLEAMALGLPVVTTHNVGASEILDEGVDGFTVPARDVEALATKLLVLFRDRERCQRMGESALEKARKYSWGRYAGEMVAAYRR